MGSWGEELLWGEWGAGAPLDRVPLPPERINTYSFQLAVASLLIRFGDNGN